MTLDPEVLLASGYAIFLMAVAQGFEALARSTSRSARLRPEARPHQPQASDEPHEASERPVPWPHWEAAAFQRGLSSVLVLVATWIVVVMMVRHWGGGESILLGLVLVGIAYVGRHAVARLRAALWLPRRAPTRKAAGAPEAAAGRTLRSRDGQHR